MRLLAEQLTLRGWQAYDAISPHDLLLSRSRPQTITAFINQFNQLVRRVGLTVDCVHASVLQFIMMVFVFYAKLLYAELSSRGRAPP